MAAIPERIGALVRRFGVRAAVFIANFGLTKGMAFLAPLAIARLLPPDVYAKIELALAGGLLLAPVLTLGTSLAIPQMRLLDRPIPVMDILGLQTGALALALTGSALVCHAAGLPAAVPLTLLATAAAIAQSASIVYARTQSWRNASVWLEGLSILTILASALSVLAAGYRSAESLLVPASVIAAAIRAAGLAVTRAYREPAFASRLRRMALAGLPLLAYALAGVWIASSGRFLIGSFLTLGDAAVYALDYRFAAILVLAHALIASGLMAQAFTMPAASFDRALAWYLCALALAAAILSAGFRWAVSKYGAPSALDPDLLAASFPAVAAQMFAMTASAALELRVNREKAARTGAIALALVAAATIAVMAGVSHAGWLTGALVIAQSVVLARAGAPSPRAQVSFIAGFAGLAALAALT